MTREESRRITLKQFLNYVDDQEIIQVCFKSEEWDNYVQLYKTSPFLKPFLDCRIACIGSEVEDKGEIPIIRISIDDSNMVYLSEEK